MTIRCTVLLEQYEILPQWKYLQSLSFLPESRNPEMN